MAGADQSPESCARAAASPRLSAHRRTDLDAGLRSTATTTTTTRSSPLSAAYASPSGVGRIARGSAGSTTPKRSVELDVGGEPSGGTASGLNVSQLRHGHTGAGGRTSHGGSRSSSSSPRCSLEASRSAGGTPKPSPRLAAAGQASPSSNRNSPRTGNASTRRGETGTPDRWRDAHLGSSGGAYNSTGLTATELSPRSASGATSLRRRPAPLDFVAAESLPVADPVDIPQAYNPSTALAKSFASMDIAADSTSAAELASQSESGLDPSGSPVIDTAIPSSRLSLSDALVLDTAGEVTFSAASFLSSSTSTSASQASTHGPSSDHGRANSHDNAFTRARWPSGGVAASGGLPFSASAAANLSSFATTTSPTTLTSYRPRATATGSLPVSPRSPPTTASHFSDLSPGVDRGQLVGLGELATPRWTSGVLERRWDADSVGASHQRVLASGEIKVSGTRYRWSTPSGRVLTSTSTFSVNYLHRGYRLADPCPTNRKALFQSCRLVL